MNKKKLLYGVRKEQLPRYNFVALLALTSFIFLILSSFVSASKPALTAVETSLSSISIFIIVLACAIGFIGFFGKHEWTAVLGGLMMIVVGSFTIINGIDSVRDLSTDFAGIFLVGLGALFAITAAVSIIEESI